MEDSSYAVLGIHDENVASIDGAYVRIRMFIGDKMVDEDFRLPRLITIEEQIDTAAKARIQEIKQQGTDASKSDVVDVQAEQIIEDIKQ